MSAVAAFPPFQRNTRRATGQVDPKKRSYRTVAAGASIAVPSASVAKQFSDLLLTGYLGPWAAEASHTSGGVVVYRWNGSYWQHVGTTEGSAVAARWIDSAVPDKASASQSESAWLYAAMRQRTEAPLPTGGKGRMIVPCRDVYLDIAADGTIAAVQPDPAFGMTYGLKIAAGTLPGTVHVPQPLPPGSRFRQWLEAAQPDPGVRDLLQEQCGMTLLPGVYSVAAWWFGAAGAGKSMLSELCEAMQSQVARVSLDTLGDTFGLESIIGASLVIVDEVEQEKWAEGRFKSLVSGNGVGVNRKNEKSLLSYHSTAKWIITSNGPPFVRDKSDGTWRRICPVEFSVVLPAEQRIEGFHNVLLADEGSLILDWMLEGARRIVQRGRFLAEQERPEAVQSAKREARKNSDSVLAWIDDEDVRFESGKWRVLDEVYKHYTDACEAAHRAPLDRTPFWRAVHASPRLSGVRTSNRRLNGKPVRQVEISWGPRPEPPKPPQASDVGDPAPVWSDGSIGDRIPGFDPDTLQIRGWWVSSVGGTVREYPLREQADAEVARRRAALAEPIS